jgi:hypothetical protein
VAAGATSRTDVAWGSRRTTVPRLRIFSTSPWACSSSSTRRAVMLLTSYFLQMSAMV